MDELKDGDFFWDIVEGLVTLAALIGVITAACFTFGYFWYSP